MRHSEDLNVLSICVISPMEHLLNTFGDLLVDEFKVAGAPG